MYQSHVTPIVPVPSADAKTVENTPSEPFYLPQYDVLYCPVNILKSQGNELRIDATDESKHDSICYDVPEQAHKYTNYSTIIGFLHLSFSFAKVSALFAFFPESCEFVDLIEEVAIIDENHRIFFDATRVWDESSSLIFTEGRAEFYRQLDFFEHYKKFSLMRYDFIREPIEILDFLYRNIRDEERGELILTIFAAAAAIDPVELMRNCYRRDFCIDDKNNVDKRFLLILRFLEGRLKANPDVTVAGLVEEMCTYLAGEGIPLNLEHCIDPDRIEEFLRDFDEDYIDGRFHLVFRTVYGKLLEDFVALNQATLEWPLAAITLRPVAPNQVFIVCRDSIMFDEDDYGIVKISKLKAFEHHFYLGILTDALLADYRGQPAPDLLSMGYSSCPNLAEIAAEMIDAVRTGRNRLEIRNLIVKNFPLRL
jgi:hypothetical protein